MYVDIDVFSIPLMVMFGARVFGSSRGLRLYGDVYSSVVLSDEFWEKARFLVTEYDGAATEIFVLDLPALQLPKVIDTLAKLPALEVLGYCEAYEKSQAFDYEWYKRLKEFPELNCQYSLRAASGEREFLQIYIENSAGPQMFDVELVFWNDLTFPPHLSEAERKAELLRLVDLAEQCRAGQPESPCILSGEHNGDPKELLDSEYAVVW